MNDRVVSLQPRRAGKSSGMKAFVREALSRVKVGDVLLFASEKRGYTCQARDARFLVCTKPFNPRRTVLYTIVDIEALERGPENLVFGMGAETREQCEEMLARLNSADVDRTELSYRRKIPLDLLAIELKAEAPRG